MGKIYRNTDELIGRTPLLEASRLQQELGLKARLLVKLEYFNPSGSVKDRIASAMILAAEKEGKLKPGYTIIEPTSGNTGIGLAAAAAAKGYKAILTMPETMSIERRKLLKGYGAQIVLTEAAKGMRGAIDKAEELAKTMENTFIPGQFANAVNPETHFKTTGPEIYEDTDGTIDILVAGVGTGGTVSGTARYLKSKKPKVRVIAVEPAKSPVIAGGHPGPHGIQGIGAGFIPETFDQEIYDEVIGIQEESAIRLARLFAHKEGVLVGISSGAALAAAVDVAGRAENQGKTIVAILPDGGERYLSTILFEE